MQNMGDSDVERGEPAADEESTAELNEFFSKVEEIKEVMAQITENISTMKGLYSKLLTATSTEDAQGTTSSVRAVPSGMGFALVGLADFCWQS
jgi:hypothetical protein